MPNTREKLIELLETVVSPKEVLCDGEVLVSTARVADRLIANGVTFATENNVGDKLTPVADNLSATAQKWIPVMERLPDSGIEVLAMLKVNKFDGHDAHNVTTAVIMPSGSWLAADYQEGIEAETAGTDCEDCCYWITHWMPLPPAPKGE